MKRRLADLALKLFSLLVAAGLWYAVAGEKTSEVARAISVQLSNVPRDLEVVGDVASEVQVRLRAAPSVVQMLGPEDVVVAVDLSGARAGDHIVQLTSEFVRAPAGVHAVKIEPAQLRLRLEPTLRRTVPVQPRLIGRPASGYEIESLRWSPEHVLVAGPDSLVSRTSSVPTEPIDVRDAQRSFTITAGVAPSGAELRVEGSVRVQVTVVVREEHRELLLERVPVQVRGGDATLEAFVDVALDGPARVIDTVDRLAVTPYIDVSQPGGGDGYPVDVELGDGMRGVTVVWTAPERVSLPEGLER